MIENNKARINFSLKPENNRRSESLDKKNEQNETQISGNNDSIKFSSESLFQTGKAGITDFFPREKVKIAVYTTYGTEKTVNVKGRVLESENNQPAKSTDSKLTNLIRNLRDLESDEISNVFLEIEFNGKKVKTKTDSDGFFSVKISDFGDVKSGFNDVKVSLASESNTKYFAEPVNGKISLQQEKDKSYGIISDIDDTAQKTGVTSKTEMFKSFLLKNEKTLEAIPGVAALYQILDKKNDGRVDGDLYYVSGSPYNLEKRINSFLRQNNFPEGSIELKNFGIKPGSDSLFAQEDYKLGKIRSIFNTYPEKKFFLFGDSGEKDPEIYQQISQEFPGRVLGIYINNVTGEEKSEKRFEGTVLTNGTTEAAIDLQKKGFID